MHRNCICPACHGDCLTDKYEFCPVCNGFGYVNNNKSTREEDDEEED